MYWFRCPTPLALLACAVLTWVLPADATTYVDGDNISGVEDGT
jgi:hypothetical protein